MKTLSGKPKTCKACKVKFTPDRPMQKACSVKCSLELARADRDKRERKEIRQAKQRIKTKSEHAREAQQAFNEWVRLRDKGLPCISCGRHHQGQWHAGHYRTVGGNPELRFEPLNCHKQCAPCNNHLSGAIVNFRIGLVKKIGAENLEWLEGPHEPKRYTIEDLQQIKAKYRAKVRELKRTQQTDERYYPHTTT